MLKYLMRKNNVILGIYVTEIQRVVTDKARRRERKAVERRVGGCEGL
jgi:hypothetical protein